MGIEQHAATIGMRSKPIFLTTAWVLKQFADKKTAEQRLYTKFVKDGLIFEQKSPWHQLKGQIFFGGSQFVAMMADELGSRKYIVEIPRKQCFPGRPPLADIFTNVIDRAADRNRKIRQAHREQGYTLQEIADALDLHCSTVSRISK